MKIFCLSLVILICAATAWGHEQEPVVGRKAAEKFFIKHKRSNRSPASQENEETSQDDRAPASMSAGNDHYLAIHLGTFIDSHEWAWGHNGTANSIGQTNFGVTYRFSEGGRSMDWVVRTEFTNYSLPQGDAFKISFVPMILFPEAESRFPLYFGAGLGPGIFAKQTPDSSPLSLDYELVAGARLFDLWRSTGAFVETGIKNDFNLIGEGQFNGFFISIGALFAF